jgi:hypothetical protein
MSYRNHVPSYRLHKQSGQAVVTFSDGLGSRRDVLLGRFGSPESRLEYARLLAEWEARARRLPPSRNAAADLTINELILAYWRFAEAYYRKNDQPTTQLKRIRLASKPVRELYGHTPARDFGPKALKVVRESMLTMECARYPRRCTQGTGCLQLPTANGLDRSGLATKPDKNRVQCISLKGF